MHGYQMGCGLLTRLKGFIELMNGLLTGYLILRNGAILHN